jgi:two-component system, OmpR family, sensor histidine kinase MprB
VRSFDGVRRRGRTWLRSFRPHSFRRRSFSRRSFSLRSFSLRARVRLLVALGVGLAVALTSVAAYATVRDQLHRQRDGELMSRARASVTTALADPEALRDLPATALGAAADLRIALLSSDGTALSARGEVDAPPLGEPELAVARGARTSSLRTAEVSGASFRVVAVPTAASGLALILAQPTVDTDRTVHRLGLVLLLVGGVGVALAAWAGAAIARAGLRPVERLTVAAENVAATQRLDAIEVHGSDEIARLTAAFNAMLAALAASRDRQRALVADAGHELRTPLTSLRTNLDLLAQNDRQGGLSAADRSEVLGDVRAQVAELSELVGDLVELAREDPPTPVREPVDLAEIVARAVDRVARRAPDVNFDTECDSFVLDGDAAALERAVTNLLDNAAKWSPRPGVVRTRLFLDGPQGVVKGVVANDGVGNGVGNGDDGRASVLNGAVLQVRDQGPGIDPADLPHVFDRFYRSAEARALPGSGLGLAIVRQAVERHGGTVEAAPADPAYGGGTVVTVRLPARC